MALPAVLLSGKVIRLVLLLAVGYWIITTADFAALGDQLVTGIESWITGLINPL